MSWSIDTVHTHVGFAVKHMMVTTVRGQFRSYRATLLKLDPKDFTKSRFEGEIDVASVDTGNPDRDNHLRTSDFFDAPNHPTITFKSTRVEVESKDRLTVFGDLTVRGTTREVPLETEIHGVGKNPYGKEVVGFTCETSINRKEWGLNWNVALEQGGWLVGDRLKITVEGQAAKEEQG